jgi:acetyltransferase-like isoleucine patch superfamily enzyme
MSSEPIPIFQEARVIDSRDPVPPNFAQKVCCRLSERIDDVWSFFFRLAAGPFQIHLGRHTKVRRGAVLSTKLGGSISLGDFCEIEPTAMILTYGGHVRMGNHCSLNPGAIIYGHGGVTIGNDVRIAAHSVIIPANHQMVGPAESIYRKPVIREGITIENDVWIGTHCVIVDGVRIAEGCVIAAGAIVTRSTEANGIYAGVPARRIKSRSDVPELNLAGSKRRDGIESNRSAVPSIHPAETVDAGDSASSCGGEACSSGTGVP